jgi:O-antigen/teichoic acid export membrane protein
MREHVWTPRMTETKTGLDHEGGLAARQARERMHLMRSGLVNYLGTLLPGLIGLAIVPVMLHALDAAAYGIWIAALSLRMLVGGIDFGLSWGVRRAVAQDAHSRGATGQPFLEGAAAVYLALGVLNGIALTVAGFALSSRLDLSTHDERMARIVFAFTGITVIGDQLFALAYSAYQGLQRFDLSSLTTIAKVALQASGTAMLLLLGHGLIAVAIWHAGVSLVVAALGGYVVTRFVPELALHPRMFSLAAFRSRVGFSIASQLIQTAFSVMSWLPPLILGAFRGSPSIVPYHVGQRFPLAIATLSERCAEVGFPSASRHASTRSSAGLRQTLEVVVRWPLVVSFPLFCIVWVIAPQLLSAWLGTVPPHATAVSRILLVAFLADTPAVGAMQVLWGVGAVRTVLAIVGTMACASTALAVVLVPHFGAAGAAAALLPPLVLGSFALLHRAARTVGIPAFRLLRAATTGLAVPFAVVIGVAVALTKLSRLEGWSQVALVTVAAGLAYIGALYWIGARTEERELIRAPLTGLWLALMRPRRSSAG